MHTSCFEDNKILSVIINFRILMTDTIIKWLKIYSQEQYAISLLMISFSVQSGCCSLTCFIFLAFAPSNATKVASLAVPCRWKLLMASSFFCEWHCHLIFKNSFNECKSAIKMLLPE